MFKKSPLALVSALVYLTAVVASIAAGIISLPLYAESTSPLKPTKPTIHKIEIQGFAFVPATIEVGVGDIVEWTNRDLAPHTATADNTKWDTGLLNAGRSGRLVVKASGTIRYHCIYHPQMRGVILVTAHSKPTSVPAK